MFNIRQIINKLMKPKGQKVFKLGSRRKMFFQQEYAPIRLTINDK